MKQYAFGIDIGGTAIKLGFFRTDGTLIEKTQIDTRTENNGEYVLPDALKAAFEMAQKNGIGWEDIEGIGMGVPGPVDKNGTVFGCVNLGWNVFNVPGRLREIEPNVDNVAVANDVNAATLGEIWKGAAKGYHSAFMLTLGTGIGAGLVVNDNIVMGKRGGAGELGHFRVNWNETEQCACGGYGCLEQYCSARGLLRCAKIALEAEPDTKTVLRDFEEFTAKDVCDAARDGDELANRLLDDFGDRLGWALTAAASTADPAVFVIGGGLSHAGSVVLDRIVDAYRKYAFHVIRNTPFVLAKLGNDAGIYGCVRMLL